jgi:lysyl-tRNA synthetase class 2
MRVFHALALPAGAALLLVAPYLLKRRERALRVAIALMLAVGVVNLLKGLDFRGDAARLGGCGGLRRAGASSTSSRADHAALGHLARAAARRARGRTDHAIADWVSHGGHKLGARPHWASPARCCASQGAVSLRAAQRRRLRHPLRVDPARGALRGDRRAAGDRLRDLPPLAAPKSLARRRSARPGRRIVRAHGRTRSRSSSCAPTSTTSSTKTARRSSATASRPGAAAVRRSGRPARAFAGLLLQVRAFARARGLKLGAVGASEHGARSTTASACGRCTSATRRSSSSTSSRSRAGRSARSVSRSAA